MQITINFPPESRPGVVTVKTWNDPLVQALTDWHKETGNFMHMDLFTPENGFQSVAGFQVLDDAAYQQLMGVQVADEYTVKQKEGWLIGDLPPTRPYWRTATELRFGTCVFGGQQVMVETVDGIKREYEFLAKYPTETTRRPVKFYKVIGLKRADFGKYTHLTAPWWIQKCTAFYGVNNYTETPRGTVYHCVWDASEYPAQGNRALYLAKDFCE